jgi:hypothetical protein
MGEGGGIMHLTRQKDKAENAHTSSAVTKHSVTFDKSEKNNDENHVVYQKMTFFKNSLMPKNDGKNRNNALNQ